eukprot:2866656-Lingulodinium_polyedra.AAC.1
MERDEQHRELDRDARRRRDSRALHPVERVGEKLVAACRHCLRQLHHGPRSVERPIGHGLLLQIAHLVAEDHDLPLLVVVRGRQPGVAARAGALREEPVLLVALCDVLGA